MIKLSIIMEEAEVQSYSQVINLLSRSRFNLVVHESIISIPDEN